MWTETVFLLVPPCLELLRHDCMLAHRHMQSFFSNERVHVHINAGWLFSCAHLGVDDWILCEKNSPRSENESWHTRHISRFLSNESIRIKSFLWENVAVTTCLVCHLRSPPRWIKATVYSQASRQVLWTSSLQLVTLISYILKRVGKRAVYIWDVQPLKCWRCYNSCVRDTPTIANCCSELPDTIQLQTFFSTHCTIYSKCKWRIDIF